ncbi:hypothetical protein ACG5V6_09705 [Streptomyces chitinivorans]|uniref:Uncharacterized protein n=1 Tax=Streptomyces chitinivorans TaxID=1257027 RepID=A0ABW7HRX2_9ACTN|nr:hypothetical protein [Streptomyces chitinivorans]MDH2410691.1 hypothetical protein [Streptomyces chitinivorans]
MPHAPADPYGLAEPAALPGPPALVARRAAPVWTAVTAPALIATVVLRPPAAGVKETGVVVALFLALAAPDDGSASSGRAVPRPAGRSGQRTRPGRRPESSSWSE